jgi:hypothetical protein
MASTHPDFVDLDASSMSDAEMLKHLQDNIVPATRSLNGEFLELDSKRGVSRCRFKIVRPSAIRRARSARAAS